MKTYLLFIILVSFFFFGCNTSSVMVNSEGFALSSDATWEGYSLSFRYDNKIQEQIQGIMLPMDYNGEKGLFFSPDRPETPHVGNFKSIELTRNENGSTLLIITTDGEKAEVTIDYKKLGVVLVSEFDDNTKKQTFSGKWIKPSRRK